MSDAEAETPILGPPDVKNWLIGKDPDAGQDWRQEEKGTTEDEIVRWHHQVSGLKFEQAPGIGDGQGSLACCSPWGHKELDTTEQLKWTEVNLPEGTTPVNTCLLSGLWQFSVAIGSFTRSSTTLCNTTFSCHCFSLNYLSWAPCSIQISLLHVAEFSDCFTAFGFRTSVYSTCICLFLTTVPSNPLSHIHHMPPSQLSWFPDQVSALPSPNCCTYCFQSGTKFHSPSVVNITCISIFTSHDLTPGLLQPSPFAPAARPSSP